MTETPGSSLLRPSLAAILDQGVVSATGFLTTVLTARALSQSGFGLFSLGMTIVLFILDLQTTLTATPYMIRSPHLSWHARRSYLSQTLATQLSLAVIPALALGVIALTSPTIDSEPIGSLLLTIAAAIVAYSLRDLGRRVSFSHLEPFAALATDSVWGVTQIGLLLLMAARNDLDPGVTFLVITAANALALIVWLWRARADLDPLVRNLRRHWRETWTLGRWTLLSGLLWSSSIYVYPWLLATLRSVEATALWAAGLGIVNLTNPVLLGIQNHLGPLLASRFASSGGAGLRRLVRRATLLMALGAGAPLVILVIVGEWLAARLYGENYESLGLLILLLSVHQLFLAIAFPFSRGLFVIEKPRTDFRVNVVGLALMLGVGIPATLLVGANGAAGALALSTGAATIVRGIAFKKEVDIA